MRFCDDPLGHCLTCSDEAIVVRVLRIETESGMAMVALAEKETGEIGERIPLRSTDPKDRSEESVADRNTKMVDILLVENVKVDDLLLVHGGVALAHYGEENEGV